MVIVGIDPGASKCGLAAINEAGKLIHKSTASLFGEPCGRDAFLWMSDLYGQLRSNTPLIVVVEEYAMYGLKASVKNAYAMGRVTQAIIDAVHYCSIYYSVPCDIHTARALDVRRFLTGNPSAKPAQIKEALTLRGYTMRMNEHERDALGLALYWLEIQVEPEHTPTRR